MVVMLYTLSKVSQKYSNNESDAVPLPLDTPSTYWSEDAFSLQGLIRFRFRAKKLH